MTSQQPLSGDSGSIPGASSSDQGVAQGVQTLKALSLNGLNQNLCHSTSASEDSKSMPSGVEGGRPHPILSWGDVTEIPNGATSKTQEYVKHPIGSSSSSEPWQVRSTQNPSRPLVRRPTPMAIRVPKSVLAKASSKIMTQSFEEEGDEELKMADGEESPVPVSLKQGTNADVLVIEDVESSDIDSPSPGLSTPKDLSLGLVVEGHSIERGRDAGSPTIVVQTDIGEKLSQEEAEQHGEAEEVENDEEEEEEDDFDVDDKQFLSPTSKSFGKNHEPPASNSHVKTVPPQPRKLVRRQTPIKLDLPKNLKEIMAKNTSEGIVEEEDEEEEENKRVSESDQQKPESMQATSNLVNEQKTSVDTILANKTTGDNITCSDTPAETAKTEVNTNAIGEDTPKNGIDADQVEVSGRPDIIDSVNCNNNNHETSALDLVEGAHHEAAKSQDGYLKDDKQNAGSTATKKKSLFKKSQASSAKDGIGSPSSARRKVSAHHTKILQRQLTPLEIEVPKHIISEAMKKKTPDSFLEEEDEDES